MRRPLCLLCLTFVAALIICLQLIPMPAPGLSGQDGRYMELEGRVYQKESRRYSGETVPVLYLKQVTVKKSSSEIQKKQIKGVMCYMEEGEEPVMGSLVRVEGRARCFPEAGNPGEFDMQGYYRTLGLDLRLEKARLLAAEGKKVGFTETLYRLKQYFSSGLSDCFGEKEASIMKALLLGEKSGLDQEVKALYQKSGIIHILAISGLHISLLGMGLYRLLLKCRLPRGLGASVSAAVLLCYTAMTGMSVSSVRAVFMFSMYLAAQLTGRSYDMLTALSVSAVVTLLWQPRYAAHSGFLFSYGAVSALGALLPALHDPAGNRGGLLPAFRRRKEGGRTRRPLPREWLWRSVSPGIATALATLPVHLFFYFTFPIYSVLLNLLVIPLMPPVMCSGLFCMVFGRLLPPAAKAVSLIGGVILKLYESCCGLAVRAPFGNPVLGQPGRWQVGGYVLLLILLVLFHKRVSAWWKGQWVILSLSLLLFRPADGLSVTVLDVGQGDCIHIAAESGSHYLIDAGSSSKRDIGTWQVIPYLKSQGAGVLKAVWVTHSDSDHQNGISTLLEEASENGIRVENLIMPDLKEDSRDDEYRRLVSLAEEQGIPVLYMSRGQSLTDGKMKITCLHPERGCGLPDKNAASLVLRLTFRSFSGLFTGDVEGEGEEELKAALSLKGGTGGRLSLLKVAHHGSGNSTKEELLSLLRPGVSFISCGENNRYGHPHPELLERLCRYGSKVYITKDSGALTVWTDGRKMKVKTFKRVLPESDRPCSGKF